MSSDATGFVKQVCERYENDPSRMMDIVRDIQNAQGCVAGDALEIIARATGTHRVEVEGVVSFYAFLSERPKGKVVVRLCDDIIDEMSGSERVADALKAGLGIDFGETTPDGAISLEYTPCIGMCDQAPAALVNDVVITELDADKAGTLVKTLQESGDPLKLVKKLGDGNNASELVQSMVKNNIRKAGQVVFAPFENGTAIANALAMSPAEVIRDVKTSRLRGRGGAGFPTGMKWDFTRQAKGDRRYVICNADEGEPGTFKDRVILTECADLMFEGMTIAGYAIGADTGILYLRGEYAYLRSFLEDTLKQRRDKGLLGTSAGGKDGFNFDIRIQMGAGAYICGEETALISSCEGLRGDPKNRPPFPAQKGYKESPTTVNNVETFCCVARILNHGPGWFAQTGSQGSPGTKVLSVSGDVKRPGVYEVPFGMSIRELLKTVGGDEGSALQVGGPSGELISPEGYDRTICYDDVATGGSVMVFSPERDVLHIVQRFMEFFVEESCGYCTPCRVGNVLLRNKVEDFIKGHGQASDIDYLQELGQTMKLCSRCGLGQTSANPVITSIKNFRPVYDAKMKADDDSAFNASFDIQSALSDAKGLTGRESEIFTK